jgi:hypothetical protein
MIAASRASGNLPLELISSCSHRNSKEVEVSMAAGQREFIEAGAGEA